MKNYALAFALILIAASAIYADIRLPETPKPANKTEKTFNSRMVIRLSNETDEPKLIIPKNQVKQLRAALEALENDSDLALTEAGGNFSRSQTVVSGFFMSLAMIFGGVWFARSRKTNSKISKKIIAGAVLFFIGATATLVYANAGPPPILRTINGSLFDKKVFGGWKTASGSIKIELSNTADQIELIVPDKPENKPNE